MEGAKPKRSSPVKNVYQPTLLKKALALSILVTLSPGLAFAGPAPTTPMPVAPLAPMPEVVIDALGRLLLTEREM